MAVKSNWENGEQFNASDANAVAEAVNAAYVKPSGGVPITDLTASVQVSLGKADTAVQSVTSTSITDSTTTGRAVVTATDASAARTTLGIAYGTTAGTVVQGNDSRLSPSSTSITDSTATGRSLLTAADAAAARTTLGVAYGSTGGTVVQGNDSRVVGAEQAANKGVANGYASLDGGGKVPVAQLPSSIMEYQGTYNASTNSPSLSNGTGNTGDVYRVTVAGSRNFGAGLISFEVGDYVIYNGSVWEKSDTTDAVSTVAGLTGDVTASSLRGAIATGTPSSTTWLRGDGAWSTLPASGITRSVQTITAPTTLGAAANTDYVYFLSLGAAADTATLAQLRFDGNLTDIANNSLTWIASGTAATTTSQSKFGTASLSPGTGYITSTRTEFAVGTSDFTFEFWIRPVGTSGRYGIFDFTSGTPRLEYTGGTLVYYDGGTSLITSGTLTANVWTHFALCRSSGTTKMFLNGTQTGSSYSDSKNWNKTKLTIGSLDGGSIPFNGNIDDFRFSSTARYTANFTAPTAQLEAPAGALLGTPTLPTAVSNTNRYTLKNNSTTPLMVLSSSSQTVNGVVPSVSVNDANVSNVVAHFHGEGANNSTTIVESSGRSTWNRVGNTKISTDQAKFGTSSIYFDGAGDYLTCPTAGTVAFGTNPYTIETWVYPTFRGVVNRHIFDSRSSTSNDNAAVLWIGTDGALLASIQNVNYWNTGANTVPLNTWTHVALCRVGTTTRLFLNGISQGNPVSDTSSYVHYSANPPAIGAIWNGSDSFFGFMDEFRITNGVGRYESNFSLPTARFSDINDPVLQSKQSLELISDGSNWQTI